MANARYATQALGTCAYMMRTYSPWKASGGEAKRPMYTAAASKSTAAAPSAVCVLMRYIRHSMMTCDAGAGGGLLRSESARLPGVTLALAAPGHPVQLRRLRFVYRARPCATRRSLTAATARL